MSKAIAEKEKSELAVAMDPGEWGVTQVSSKDIIIPRILLMQPMSEKVTAGDAAFGDFRDSLNNQKIGDFKTPFDFIPFHMEKLFIEYRVIQEGAKVKKQFLRVVPITPKNEDLPYEDIEKGEDGTSYQIARDYTMNFYVLLPDEIETGAIPYILTARRTSLKAGKKLATQMFVKNISAGKTPASVVCRASVGKQSNDEGTWAVLDITSGDQTKPEHVVEALKWFKMIKAGKAKAHEEALVEEENIATPVARDVSDVNVEEGPSNF